MNRIMVLVACLIALTTGAVSAQEREQLRIAFDVPYEPFEYRTPEGELTGFEVDLARAVCEEMAVNCEFVVQDWDGIIPGLQARKYDAIMSSMSITDERKKVVRFSEPYYNTPSAWFAREDIGIDKPTREALKGKVVGVQRGTTQDTYVTENFAGVIDIKRYTTADDLVLDLTGQRLDLVFLDFPVGDETILNKGGYTTVGDEVKLGEGIAVAMRKRDKELEQKFNQALETLKSDGTYDRIMKKYFDYDIKV